MNYNYIYTDNLHIKGMSKINRELYPIIEKQIGTNLIMGARQVGKN